MGVSANSSIWDKLTQFVIGLVVIAIVLLIFNYYRPLIDENERMRREINRLDGEINVQRQISMELSNQIYILYNDPKTVERLAREKLGLARADETVIHFEPATNSIGLR